MYAIRSYYGTRTLSSPRETGRAAEATLGVDWNPDPWNALGRTRDAAALEAQASYADLDEAARALAATVADLYWQLLYTRERIAMSGESIAYARRTYELTQSRYAAGAVSSLDVLEAEQALRTQEAADTEYRQSLVETENALAILFDGPPAPADAPRATLPAADPPAVDAGRITSYNVCYTKLLRWARSARKRTVSGSGSRRSTVRWSMAA